MNAARDEGRRRSTLPDVALEDQAVELAAPDPGSAREDRSDVKTALSRVAEPFRSAVVLVDLEQLGYDEAASALGCSIGTVKSRVHRGRLLFRDHWVRLTKDRNSTEAAGSATAGGMR